MLNVYVLEIILKQMSLKLLHSKFKCVFTICENNSPYVSETGGLSPFKMSYFFKTHFASEALQLFQMLQMSFVTFEMLSFFTFFLQ